VESQNEFSEMDIYKCPKLIYGIYFFLEETEIFPYAVEFFKMKIIKQWMLPQYFIKYLNTRYLGVFYVRIYY
jgi:hypothetical protein